MSYRVDTTRGQRLGTVNAQSASRPADERFLTLESLREHVSRVAAESVPYEVRPFDIEIDHSAEMGLYAKVGDVLALPTHYAFGRIAAEAGVPASYLRNPRVPPQLAALNLRNGLAHAEAEQVSVLVRHPGASANGILRTVTSTSYGRILDRDVVDAVIGVAGDRWKVPGMLDWSAAGGTRHDPEVPVSIDSTTLYASDRDVWLFLCDDRNPVQVGTLRDGSPDLMFRGFYVWNSEVGDRTFGVATMWLRGVCCNRNLWGVEGFREMMIRHTSGAPSRFLSEAAPRLADFAEDSAHDLVQRVGDMRAIRYSADPKESYAGIAGLLAGAGFGRRQTDAIIATDPDGGAGAEEPRPIENFWELSQAATAWARSLPYEDERVDAEARIGKMVERVIA